MFLGYHHDKPNIKAKTLHKVWMSHTWSLFHTIIIHVEKILIGRYFQTSFLLTWEFSQPHHNVTPNLIHLSFFQMGYKIFNFDSDIYLSHLLDTPNIF